jgi:hypothetical protein
VSLAIAEGLKLPKGSRFSIGAVPAAIAGVAPTLDFRPALERREIEAVSLTDKLTFTGGNQGTFVGSDGYIQRAQTNVPRFTHDPVTRRSLGMLLEASSENLLLRSEQFNQSPWDIAAGTITASTQTAPDGKPSAYLMTATSTTPVLTQSISKAATAQTYTGSFWLKSNQVSDFSITIDDGTPVNRGRARFNPVAGTIGAITSDGAFTNTTALIIPFLDFWYRCVITTRTNAVATARARLFFTGVGNSVGLYGGQLGPTLTSYIPTTTTAVTRSADSAVLDGTGVITGTCTMVEKPEGCAVVSGTNINLQNGFTVERVMIFPATLTAGQITAIRAAM